MKEDSGEKPWPQPPATAGGQSQQPAPTPQRPPLQYSSLEEGVRLLPPYARSLLKIKVPVAVTLASKKQPLGRILKLGLGSIIQFEKSCDDSLALSVGDQQIAVGEAVKVGEHFGLWITAMTMPDERFWAINPVQGKVRVK